MNTRLMTACLVSAMAATVLRAADAPPVCNIKVLPDKAIDCSSLSNIVATVTRGCKSNDEKMMAIDNFMRISHYHRQYPPAGPSLLWFTNYGWSLCGGFAGLQCSLYSQIPGWGWRHVGWPGHNMSEAYYDGAWHWVDCFLKFHAWRPDAKAPNGRTIACQNDLAANPNLVNEDMMYDPVSQMCYDKQDRREMIKGKLNWTAPVLLTCGDELSGIMGGVNSRTIDGEHPPEDGCKPETYFAEVNLRPGQALENSWDQLLPPEESWPNLGDGQGVGHTCKNKDLRNDPSVGPVMEPYFQRIRSYSNGRLIYAPDFSKASVMQTFVTKENAKYDNGAIVPEKADAPASVTVVLESPYLIQRATGSADGADTVSISTDGGKTFSAAELKNFTSAVKNRQAFQVKVTFKMALKSLQLEAIVLNNAGVQPFLCPGKNIVAVTVADPKALGANKLVVTYAYQPGYRTKSFEQLFDEGQRFFVQANATWATATTVVQKSFSAAELPATFEINVPTPKDKYPVYPRMLFLRREVVPADAKPMALPANVQEPKMDAGDELKVLPNPFLIGTQPPPGHVEPPTATNRVAVLAASHAVCISGETATNHFIKWPPDNKPDQTWVLLVGGEIKGLPDSKEITRAFLNVPILRGKNSATTKVCVLALKAPFEAGKTYDFANLGDTVGTFTVPKQEGPDYNPPRMFRVDVAQYIKRLARGEVKFNGLAIRVLQDRGVDEGHIIRIDMPNDARLPLELETLLKAP